MVNLNDFVNAVNDYLTNSGQNTDDWDVWRAAIQMRDAFPEAESVDDIDPDDFNEILSENQQ